MAKFKISKSGNSKYRIALSGSLINLVIFTITNSLTQKFKLRILTGIVSALTVMSGVFLFIFPSYFANKFGYPLILGGAVLGLSFIFSSSRFELVLENDISVETSKERKEAEELYEADKTNPFSFLEVDSLRLNEY